MVSPIVDEIHNFSAVYVKTTPKHTDYAKREIEWYESQSLYVKDIPGKVLKIWEMCADKDGKINSNYGWCI